jgi:hypothetical protein
MISNRRSLSKLIELAERTVDVAELLRSNSPEMTPDEAMFRAHMRLRHFVLNADACPVETLRSYHKRMEHTDHDHGGAF